MQRCVIFNSSNYGRVIFTVMNPFFRGILLLTNLSFFPQVQPQSQPGQTLGGAQW